MNQGFSIKNIFLLWILMSGLCLGFACPGIAAGINMAEDGLALKGYDAVAYFTDQEAVRGKGDYEYEWQGAKWRFASDEHRKLFMQAPEKYAPQYGGYCAFAVSKGSRAPADPQAWSIVNHKLYFNFNRQVRNLWQKDLENNIRKADNHWQQMSNN
ncbi:MAG: YHS domain-containing protein [Candidatus Omnitrophica bacterium]|nr:YHS domain-containing protein [Candidatus Omnitrophota bacterium]